MIDSDDYIEGFKEFVDRIHKEVAVGRINDPTMADEIISSGTADYVSLGRASIADPEFPNKVMEKRINEISPCVGCLTRCQGVPDIDPKDIGVSCMINPFSGHELTMKIEKTLNPKSVVVVGGGPGGLEASWVLAARGHKVTLLEKNSKLGGQIISDCNPPCSGCRCIRWKSNCRTKCFNSGRRYGRT